MPRVTIGLPVYNGEKLVGEALESLLGQTVGDFEIIISDNASTDGTEEICRGYVERDPRLRYDRSPTNVGAAGNFNRIFPLATGQYFKWAAHDDLLAPDFLERCVEVLDRDPSVVLCAPRAMIIDAAGEKRGLYEFEVKVDSDDAAERFRETLRGHKCYEVFGLIRTDVLKKTDLIGLYAHGDGVLLSDLALRGKFCELPEPLFFPREHDTQSMAMVWDYHAYTAWFDSGKAGKIVFPCWRILREYIRVVNRAPISIGRRMACRRHIAAWCVEWRRRLRGDLTAAARRVLGIPRKAKPTRQAGTA